MLVQNFPLVSWGNGTFMIGVFVLVCIALIAAMLLLVNSGSSKSKEK